LVVNNLFCEGILKSFKKMSKVKVVNTPRQEIDQEIDFVEKIFPHIKSPTPVIRNIAETIWRLFTSKANEYTDYSSLCFPINGCSFSAESPHEALTAVKEIVKTINRYKIEDETAIVYLFQHNIQLPKYKITETEFKIISELIKNPNVSNREIAKHCNLSEVWVSKEKNKLIKKRVLVPLIAIDYSCFGLIYKLILFSTSSSNCGSLLPLLMKNPYVFQITKVFDIASRNTQCHYLVSLLIPSKYQDHFKSWISNFFRSKIVQDISLLTIREFNHSLNLSLYKKGRWYFDGLRDTFLFLRFLRMYTELIQAPDFSHALKYTRNV